MPSFSELDVDEFLQSYLEHVEVCDLADDHPSRNPWFNGSWIYPAQDAWDEHGPTDFPYIVAADVPAFLAAVGERAFQLGYADGVGKTTDD